MGVGELDEYCTKLLAVFILEARSFRFNKLKGYLDEMGLKMSTPTLIHHLKHLTEKQLVVRDEKERQHVTYRFYSEKWQDADELVKERIFMEKVLQQEMDKFGSRSVMDQVMYVNNIAVLLFLQTIRESLVAKVKPEKEFVVNINLIHFGNIFHRVRNMILENVDKKGEKYATECIIAIDKLIKLYVEDIQDPKREKGFYRVYP